jgi:hypothetical protein
VGDVIPDDGKLLDESMLLDKIASFQNDELLKALGRNVPGQIYMRLKWQQRITLQDADYILCRFDSPVRIEPGNNPRALILFNSGYELKTWGRFICEPGFDSGHIINPIGRPETYFETVNVSGRSGGSLSFEKYLITPSEIQRLDRGY